MTRRLTDSADRRRTQYRSLWVRSYLTKRGATGRKRRDGYRRRSRKVSVAKWTIGMALVAICAAPAVAQQSIQTAFNYNLADDAAAPAAPETKADDKGSCDCAKATEASC